MVKQHIQFGLHLDGQRVYRHQNSMGFSVLGPQGLLSVLETQLGLVQLPTVESERIVQYRHCLKQNDSLQRFYHQSFEKDPLGVAATLLKWRDEWYLHGWNGTCPPTNAGKVFDIAQVETHARGHVAKGMGERLADVLNELSVRKIPIESITLVDQLEDFPIMWQKVLNLLPFNAYLEMQPQGQGFLLEIQKTLIKAARGDKYDKIKWIDDGSVVVAQSQSLYAAHNWLMPQIESSQDTLIIANDNGTRLDEHLVSVDKSKQGFKESSSYRPALQVLPLAMELLWDPLDYFSLVEFLCHPICPVKPFASRIILEKICDKPGISGEAWNRTINSIRTQCGSNEEFQKIETQISVWIEHPKFQKESGVTIATVIERVKRLCEFFQIRLGEEDPVQLTAFASGFSQCKAAMKSLEALIIQGETNVLPQQLRKIIAKATLAGSNNALQDAQIGACLISTKPGAVVQPVQKLVWTDLTLPVLPNTLPWTNEECEALSKAGTVLPSTDQLLSKTALDWLRPILAASDSVVLLLPNPGVEVHPIWQMIHAVNLGITVIDVESTLHIPNPNSMIVEEKKLPEKKRWWDLPSSTRISLRDAESFSSLEPFLFNPYVWVLKNTAKLKKSELASLKADMRLLGVLSHRMIELYFLEPTALTMTEANIDAWLDTTFPRVLNEDGAVFLMPGFGAQVDSFKQKMSIAIKSLQAHVAREGIVSVECEKRMRGTFEGGALQGDADLLFKDGRNQLSIVDMKWSGGKKYPTKLKEHRHLQLAIYAHLCNETNGAWPAVAYFIIEQGRFYTPDTTHFSNGKEIIADNNENTLELWNRFKESWKWRHQLLLNGRIEVALESIPEDQDSVHPVNGLRNEYLEEAYNDFINLAGWSK